MDDMVKTVTFCEYCSKEFTTRGSLLRNQRTVTSCIQLQKNGKCERFECQYCNKSYTDRSNLNRHLPKCEVKKDSEINREINELKKEISKKRVKNQILKNQLKEQDEKWKEKTRMLKNQLKRRDEEITSLKIKCESSKVEGKVEVYDKVCTKVLDKPTVTNTTNTTYIHPKLINLPITTIHPLTPEYVKEQVDNGEYTFKNYLDGEKGIVDFIYSITMCENEDGVVERSYVSTDASRDSYHRLIETKEWEKDKGGKFIDVIFDALCDRVDDYHKDVLEERIKDGSKSRGHKPELGYKPDFVFKKNTDMHSGIVQTHGKERRSLRQRIKKETGKKISV